MMFPPKTTSTSEDIVAERERRAMANPHAMQPGMTALDYQNTQQQFTAGAAFFLSVQGR